MNILLNIDEFAGRSIVPVLCGEDIQGTAFFISSTHLLTAGHVIGPHIAFSSIPIFIKIGNEYVPCKLISNDNEPDYALLECIDYECPEEYILEIVGGSFRKNQQCVIIGYPMELGNGHDYYAVEVKNIRKKDNLMGGFDRIVLRTDYLGFHSYCGFSGSPVFNKSGKVIGLQTDQLFNSLGYASINSFIDVIGSKLGITIESDDALFDDTTYGLYTAKKHTEAQYEKGQYRFKKGLHVPMVDEEIQIESFCGYGLKEREKKIHSDFCEWYSKLAFKELQYVSSKQNIVSFLSDGKITEDFRKELYELMDEQVDNSYKLPNNLRKELGTITQEISKYAMGCRLFSHYRYMCVSGVAGVGKSYLLYREALKISEQTHIYLFQGLEFMEGEMPLDTIVKTLNWGEDNPLEKLNDSLAADNRYAVFFIDAINEGAGRSFWKDALPQLKEKFSDYSRLKLLISIRKLTDDDQLSNIFDGDWRRIELDGFSNVEDAFVKFFEAYEIKDDYKQYLKIEEFSNPLFMKIFCETYRQLSAEERRNALRLPIYRKYLKQRNIDVSKIVDEDCVQDITSRLVLWVANQSVMQYSCGNVPRQQVFKRARRISIYRPWSKSLLFACLKCSVLKEYMSIDGQDYIDFEYDSLGDFLKAGCLLDRNISDKEKLCYIKNAYGILANRNTAEVLKSKNYSFIRAFLSIWNPASEIWNEDIFQKGDLTSILLSSLHFRNVRDKENTLTSYHIESILQNNSEYREPELILNNFSLYSKGLFQPVHEYLLSLEMSERDYIWTTKVNALYEWAQYDELLSKITPNSPIEVTTLLQMEAWMLTSSFPYIRFFVTRKLQKLFTDYPDQIIRIIESFRTVDDSFIHIGLYSSIYGALITIQDLEFVESIGQKIYEIHYEDGKAPNDIMVRHWTLKIFEYIYHVYPKSKLWHNAQPPYSYPENLFEIIGDNDFDIENYFGESMGSKRIQHSLYHWDFSRYIIGTNSNTHSREFYKNEKEPVKLRFIENAIAFLIKNKYGWNDKLGEYDASVPYQARSENAVERIGKKYQWLGLNEVYAYLCDVCKVKINIWSAVENFAEVNYPWYVKEKGYYDPALPSVNIAREKSYELFDVLMPESSLDLDETSFLSNGMNHVPLYITVKDKTGDEWVSLVAYSKMEETEGISTRERFVFYNPIIVGNDKIEEFREWMSDKNFYGRWMPEHTGSIDFRWNEFPWADSYRALDVEDDGNYTEEGHQFRLPYFAQLQEYTEGYPEDFEYLATAYMPFAEMMETMDWHTAERGIIRDANQNVVAINRCMDGDPMDALYVRKSAIDTYLTKTNQSLFYALVGELVIKVGYNYKDLTRLTGAAMYTSQKGVEVIQDLRKEPEVNPKEELTKDEIDELSALLPKTILKTLHDKKKSEILKALSSSVLKDSSEDNDGDIPS